MDQKQFFESFISLLSDASGHKLNAFDMAQEVFTSVRVGLSSTPLRAEFEQIERELLFRVWMFEQICNGEAFSSQDSSISGPLIIISLQGEIIFANKFYCALSGLSPEEVRTHSISGELFAQVYEGSDVDRAREGVSRLEVGRGYKNLELFMKHSGHKTSWNSYGGAGEALEVRSGRELNPENNQTSERERFYRGSIMNTARLVANMCQVSIHGILSAENEQKLAWIRELLSIFDFLWNHSEFFMETIDMPTTNKGKITGMYNTIYAQFLRRTFEEDKKFKDILSRAHNASVTEFLSTRKLQNLPLGGEYVFHEYNKRPVAKVYWQYRMYPYPVLPGYEKIFSFGIFVQRIQKRNIFIRIFRFFFRKK